jgi:hypothetical protein
MQGLEGGMPVTLWIVEGKAFRKEWACLTVDRSIEQARPVCLLCQMAHEEFHMKVGREEARSLQGKEADATGGLHHHPFCWRLKTEHYSSCLMASGRAKLDIRITIRGS